MCGHGLLWFITWHCWQEQPRLLSCSLWVPWTILYPFDRCFPASQCPPKTDKLFQLCSHWGGEEQGLASSWEWPQSQDVIHPPGCESTLDHLALSADLPSLRQVLGKQREPSPAGRAAQPLWGCPWWSQEWHKVWEQVRRIWTPPHTQPGKFSLLLQIQMWWHRHSHTPELNTSTGYIQLQDVLPGYCFVQAKSPWHARKSEQRFWV